MINTMTLRRLISDLDSARAALSWFGGEGADPFTSLSKTPTINLGGCATNVNGALSANQYLNDVVKALTPEIVSRARKKAEADIERIEHEISAAVSD